MLTYPTQIPPYVSCLRVLDSLHSVFLKPSLYYQFAIWASEGEVPFSIHHACYVGRVVAEPAQPIITT